VAVNANETIVTYGCCLVTTIQRGRNIKSLETMGRAETDRNDRRIHEEADLIREMLAAIRFGIILTCLPPKM
jgi:hypothetical protein